ncbi:SDR family NAD(P)-dependent oxidoreductase [Myxococcus sp. 1LA]
MSNIQGKVVVVTGASSGLGEETARHLASLRARRTDRLASVVADIEREGGQAGARAVDVTKRARPSFISPGAVQSALPMGNAAPEAAKQEL